MDEKISIRLSFAASILLLIAGLVFLFLRIRGHGGSTHPLAIALACIAVANALTVVRNRKIAKQKKDDRLENAE